MHQLNVDYMRKSDTKNADFNRRWLYRVGAAAALTVLMLFLIGVKGIISVFQSAPSNSWITQIQNNWLIVLFKLNAGYGWVRLDLFNLLDIFIIALFCIIFLALYASLKHTSSIWSLIAAILPFIGIPVFLLTATAGRSTLLIGGLMFSAVMLRSNIFSKITAYMGIVASTLLFFTGDLATAIYSSSLIIAFFIGVGYVLWMLWLTLIARRFLQLGHGV
jgi:hypothetical protein